MVPSQNFDDDQNGLIDLCAIYKKTNMKMHDIHVTEIRDKFCGLILSVFMNYPMLSGLCSP